MKKKNNIYYNNKDTCIDTDKLKLFTSFSFVDDNYKKFEDEGYDNRIYSQWYNNKNKENKKDNNKYLRFGREIKNTF